MTDNLKPEERARVWIDQKLTDAGWHVINRDEFAPGMSAVAIREASLRHKLEADYLLLINGYAVAVLEAKRKEVRLDNADLIAQAENYAWQLKPWYPHHDHPLKLIYLSNGEQIAVKNALDADPEYRLISEFPRPKDVVRQLNMQGFFDGLPFLNPKGLRKCQFEAITNLEASFKDGKKKAVMVLATGAGKTFTAVMSTYRMLAYTPMKRVLFLVDRNNLGRAAAAAFQDFRLTETGKPFSDIYQVEQLGNRPVEAKSGVVISTIQRLFSQLTGNNDISSEEDEDTRSAEDDDGQAIQIPANPKLPPDFFDLIIIDECHRSIYSKWQQVLKYFKTARLLGLTATPIPETLAFFDNNRVANYTLEDSIIDGVNVSYRVYRIKTQLGENGGEIKRDDAIHSISRKTGESIDQKAVEDRTYSKTELNRRFMVEDEIRKVLEQYRDAVYTSLYPDREPNFDYLPKTLIFGVSELHAQLIVKVAKEVFGRTDDKFVQRITYSCDDSNRLIREFRNDPAFRIAVTVTLVATGTDVRPLEVLIFLNDVHSETLYTQMKGRGVRTISDGELQSVTPNAHSKELFYIIDAVGVTESEKFVPAPGTKGEFVKTPTLEELFEKMALRYVPDDYMQLLASKLAYLWNHSEPEDRLEIEKQYPVPLTEFARRIVEHLQSGNLPPFTSSNEPNAVRMQVLSDLLTNIPARQVIIKVAKGFVKELVGAEDEVISAGFSTEEAARSTEAFERFVNTHRDEIEALRLIYNQQAHEITRDMVFDLEHKLQLALPGFQVGQLWGNYALLAPGNVVPLKSEYKGLTSLIQLVRYAYKMIDSLCPLQSLAAKRFELWCGQKQLGLVLTDAQKELFRQVAIYIAQNGRYDFPALFKVDPETAKGLIRMLGTPKAANEKIFSLNEFILKAA